MLRTRIARTLEYMLVKSVRLFELHFQSRVSDPQNRPKPTKHTEPPPNLEYNEQAANDSNAPQQATPDLFIQYSPSLTCAGLYLAQIKFKAGAHRRCVYTCRSSLLALCRNCIVRGEQKEKELALGSAARRMSKFDIASRWESCRSRSSGEAWEAPAARAPGVIFFFFRVFTRSCVGPRARARLSVIMLIGGSPLVRMLRVHMGCIESRERG